MIGGVFAMMGTKHNQALILTPYFVGSIMFSIGSYCGLLEVINIHNEDHSISEYCFKGRKHWH